MTNKTRITWPLHLLTIASIVIAAVTMSTVASAGPNVVPIDDVSYNVNVRLTDNLRTLMGKRIHVSLNSGKEITGTVRDIGNQLVHLEKIEGRDYFDALIRVDSINAVDTRFRKVER